MKAKAHQTSNRVGWRNTTGLLPVGIATLMLLSTPTPASACVGARALGMGGAFIGVADDASTTYWNPAGLAFMEQRQVTGMFIPGDDINYKFFGSYSQPLGERFAFGVAGWTWNPMPIAYMQGSLIEREISKPWVSFAMRIPQVEKGELAIGANLSFAQADLTWRNDKVSLDVDPGLDLAVLYKINEQFSVGLLIQDVNEPSMTLNGQNWGSWKRNVRPGIAFRPNEQLTLSADIYDLTDGQYLMLGAEYWVNEEIGVRGGIYSIGGADFPAVGASYRFNPSFTLEVGALDFEHFILSGTFMF